MSNIINVDVDVVRHPIEADVSEVKPSGGHTEAEVRDGILYIEDIDGVEFIIGG